MILYRQRLALGGDRIAWVACGIYPEAISDGPPGAVMPTGGSATHDREMMRPWMSHSVLSYLTQ
jgi:hypothetical protein